MTTAFEIKDNVAVKGVVTAIRVDLRNIPIYKVKLQDVNGDIGYMEVIEADLLHINEEEDVYHGC